MKTLNARDVRTILPGASPEVCNFTAAMATPNGEPERNFSAAAESSLRTQPMSRADIRSIMPGVADDPKATQFTMTMAKLQGAPAQMRARPTRTPPARDTLQALNAVFASFRRERNPFMPGFDASDGN